MKKSSLILLLFPLLLIGCTEGNPPNNEENEQPQEGVVDAIVYKIKIITQPNKRTYYVGEIFDPTGMEVEVLYKSDSQKEPEIIEDFTFDKTPLVLGQQKVTISYKGKKATVDIVVKQKQAEDLDEYTKTIKFHEAGYTTKFPEGTNFDQQSKFDQLYFYIDEQLDYYDLINSITLVKGQSRKVNSDTYLQLGTGSGMGSLTWECKEKIYSIQIDAMAYSKYDDYHKVWNVDRLSHLKINDQDYSLEVPSGEPEIIHIPAISFDEGINDFTLTSSGGRVLISEMTITWRG